MNDWHDAALVLAEQLEHTQHDLHEAKLRLVAAEIVSLCATRAFIATHPEPEALVEAWNQEVAMMWATSTPMLESGDPNPLAPHIQRLLRMVEAKMEPGN